MQELSVEEAAEIKHLTTKFLEKKEKLKRESNSGYNIKCKKRNMKLHEGLLIKQKNR